MPPMSPKRKDPVGRLFRDSPRPPRLEPHDGLLNTLGEKKNLLYLCLARARRSASAAAFAAAAAFCRSSAVLLLPWRLLVASMSWRAAACDAFT